MLQVGASVSVVSNSNAPMSQAAPCGRATPRWSIVTGMPSASLQSKTGIASMAGLPGKRAWVWVGPPLS